MSRDPVCGMNVLKKMAKFESVHEGTIYYFCSAQCNAIFDAVPGKYTGRG